MDEEKFPLRLGMVAKVGDRIGNLNSILRPSLGFTPLRKGYARNRDALGSQRPFEGFLNRPDFQPVIAYPEINAAVLVSGAYRGGDFSHALLVRTREQRGLGKNRLKLR